MIEITVDGKTREYTYPEAQKLLSSLAPETHITAHFKGKFFKGTVKQAMKGSRKFRGHKNIWAILANERSLRDA